MKIEEKKANKALLDKMEIENVQVKFGGYWSPKNCQARHKVSKQFVYYSLDLLADK